jgi:protein-S-isoprenylcysteine O-methyltransferase Ste14
MADIPDSAGVRVPPPLLYAFAILGGYVLNRQYPLPVGNALFITVLAWAMTLGWVALTVSSIGTFWRSRTSIVPVRPATALVIVGPYRFTRNPMYVGLALLTCGLALFMNTWWPIVLLVPVLLIVHLFVIAPEERYLRRRFGAEYEAYMDRVRRWV